jgi:hypothetical protein
MLLAWEPPVDNRVAGYKIYVDQKFNSKVRSPERTKALINGVEGLKRSGASVVVEIRSIAVDGSVSPPAGTRISVPPAPPSPASSSEDQHAPGARPGSDAVPKVGLVPSNESSC